MTPEQEALREKVAREIYDILEGPVADQDFGRQTRQWELSLVLADAAIAVVLKEAPEIKRLRAVLARAVLDDGGTCYNGDEDEVGYRCCCGVVSYGNHRPDCWVLEAHAALNPSSSPAAS